MKVTLNGSEREVSATSVARLICELHLDARTLAVEHNGIVLARKDFEATRVQQGDRIELVRLVGGG